MKPIFTLLLESFRGLKSQLIFWITLGLSLLVALIFLSIGFDDEGMTFFFGLSGFAEENLAEEGPMRSIVYKMIFSNAVGGFWLTWIATILALISCAPIFPNTMTEGGAGMVMTKSVPRLQIFAAKFVGSLFFVTIQVGLFMVIVFIAFKWRLGVWYPQLFWYLPAVLLVFVSLYSFLVLVAVKTRSVLTALLLTFLVWGISGALGWAEGILRARMILEERQEEQASNANANAETKTEGEAGPSGGTSESQNQNQETETVNKQSPGRSASLSDEPDLALKKWHGIVKVVHSFFPKNGPVMAEAEKKLLFNEFENIVTDPQTDQEKETAREMSRQRDSIEHGNSSFYTIWSSVLFAAVMMSLAAMIFCRRDY